MLLSKRLVSLCRTKSGQNGIEAGTVMTLTDRCTGLEPDDRCLTGSTASYPDGRQITDLDSPIVGKD